MSQGASTPQQHYFVPQPMYWPVLGSMALFLMALGGVFVMNAGSGGWVSVAAGFMLLLYMMFRWFGDVIAESEGGRYHGWEDVSFRWGMSWFIFSEVMFFAAFFGALFYIRVLSVPDLASLDHRALLWPDFKSVWPSAGPGFEEKFSPMGAWGLPAINTALLLSSGVTVTIVTGRDDEKSIPVAARVAKDGTVDISPIGPVQVGNLDPVDASQEIAAAAVERGIYVQPNVTVEFKKKAVNHITVLGAVEEPGLHEVPRNSSDVVSAIALAGGLTEEAGTEVEIIRQHARANGNYTRFAEDQPANPVDSGSGSDAIMLAAYSSLAQQPTSAGAPSAQGGPLSQHINLAEVASRGIQGDYRLDDRDVVMVKARPKRTIHVGGLVKTPGKFELPLAEDVRLLDAIALAGGCTSVVADKVFVIRPVKGRPQPVVIQASMQRAKHDGQENLVLSEGDMVSIEQTPTTAVFDTLSRLFHLTIGVTGNGIF